MASAIAHIVARKQASEAKGICLGRLILTRSVQMLVWPRARFACSGDGSGRRILDHVGVKEGLTNHGMVCDKKGAMRDE